MKISLLLYFLITATFIFFTDLYGQQEYSGISLRIRNPKDAFGVADGKGNLAYIFEGHKQYHIALIQANGGVGKNFIANRIIRGKKDKIIGAVLREDIFIAYFYSKKHGTLSSLVLNIETGSYKYFSLKTLAEHEQFLRAFTMNEKFYMLTVPRQKNILNVYESAEGDKVEAGTYGIEMTTFYGNLSASNDQLNETAESAVGIETVRTRLDNNIKSAYPKKKLYYENNKIYLVFDEPSSTNLIIIDLVASKSYYKKLNFNLELGNNSSSKRGNSFLYDDKIFRATISPDMMNISIIELDSIRLINSYNIYPDQDINILNGPIVQEGGTNTFSTTDERVLSKTGQYFNRVLSGNISIAANRIDSGRVELEVGSYEEIINRGNMNGFGNPAFSFGMGMGMGMGGMGFGNPYYSPFGSPFGGGFGSGFYGYPGYYPYGGGYGTRLRIVSFKTLLRDPNYNHVDGTVPKTLREKINEYGEERFKKHVPELYTITSLNEQKLLMGYYMKHTNKFEVVSFDKPGATY